LIDWKKNNRQGKDGTLDPLFPVTWRFEDIEWTACHACSGILGKMHDLQRHWQRLWKDWERHFAALGCKFHQTTPIPSWERANDCSSQSEIGL
jgi:hypothetical protein